MYSSHDCQKQCASTAVVSQYNSEPHALSFLNYVNKLQCHNLSVIVLNFQQLYTVISTNKAAISCVRNRYLWVCHDEEHTPLTDTVILFTAVNPMADAGQDVSGRYITAFT